jgi:SM-20-related protein
LNTLSENVSNINTCLDLVSWYSQENFISDEICQNIFDEYTMRDKAKTFSAAAIGNFGSRSDDVTIRKSSISWIESTDNFAGIKELNLIFEQIMLSINRYFFLSMKSYESQVAYYVKNDFYKTHLDQFSQNRHRHVTCSLYLNDCPTGGELVIYKKGSKVLIDKVISPKRGTLVVFFSGHIFHEVKMVESPRFSLSTWFRDD